MIFCGITLLPGERKNVTLPVPDAPSLNALCLCGAAPGKTLVVTAGVHGCEYVGIQALRRLAADLDPARLSGNVILLPLDWPLPWRRLYTRKPICWQISTAETAAKRFIHWCSSRQQGRKWSTKSHWMPPRS